MASEPRIAVSLTSIEWFAVRASLLMAAHTTEDISYREIEVSIDNQLPIDEEQLSILSLLQCVDSQFPDFFCVDGDGYTGLAN